MRFKILKEFIDIIPIEFFLRGRQAMLGVRE